MEKIGAMIERLQEQYREGADAQAMLLTLQLLQKELLPAGAPVKRTGRAGVSVVIPGQLDLRFDPKEGVPDPQPESTEERLVFELTVEEDDGNLPAHEEMEMPTLAHQRRQIQEPAVKKELNEVIETAAPTVNDLIEAPAKELGHTLHLEPVKDLKKAISINERYQYIKHLFMNDESMYERSIKTINNFVNHAEARYWIQRELAVKMGWRDDDPLVQELYLLVSRRFL